jgi:hypothetical protein
VDTRKSHTELIKQISNSRNTFETLSKNLEEQTDREKELMPKKLDKTFGVIAKDLR